MYACAFASFEQRVVFSAPSPVSVGKTWECLPLEAGDATEVCVCVVVSCESASKVYDWRRPRGHVQGKHIVIWHKIAVVKHDCRCVCVHEADIEQCASVEFAVVLLVYNAGLLRGQRLQQYAEVFLSVSMWDNKADVFIDWHVAGH